MLDFFLRTEAIKPLETAHVAQWIATLNSSNTSLHSFLSADRFIIVDSLNIAFNKCWEHVQHKTWNLLDYPLSQNLQPSQNKDILEDYYIFFFPFHSWNQRMMTHDSVTQINFVVETMYLLSNFGNDNIHYLIVHKYNSMDQFTEGFFPSKYPNIWIATIREYDNDLHRCKEVDDLLVVSWTYMLGHLLRKDVSILGSDHYDWAQGDLELYNFIQNHKGLFKLEGNTTTNQITSIIAYLNVPIQWRTRILLFDLLL